LSRKARRLQRRQHTHFAEQGHVAGEERFTNMEAREKILLKHEHAFAGPRQKGRRATAARAAADDQRVISVLIHLPKFEDVMNDGKLGNRR